MTNDIIREELSNRILLLDGAMGTVIQKYNLKELDFREGFFEEHKFELKGLNDVLVFTRPDLIKQIHRQYIEAGADIIETNTFNSNCFALADYGLDEYTYKLNRKAALLAKDEAEKYFNLTGKKTWVAGSVGPSNKTASIATKSELPEYREVNYDEIYNAYRPQIEGLIDGGADLFLVETIFDMLTAKSILVLIKDICQIKKIHIPVIISATLTESGRLLSGQTISSFYHSLKHFEPLSIGFNCGFGAEKYKTSLLELSAIAECPIHVYPNAGFPDENGKYSHTPKKMGELLDYYFSENLVNIIGGCCGTTPTHIATIKKIIGIHNPRKYFSKNIELYLSGLEALKIDKNKYIKVGERTNVAGSRKFAKLIIEQKYSEAVEIAREQITQGADIIDICLDEPMIDSIEAMKVFINYLLAEPDIAKIPFMLDSSNWELIEESIKLISGKAIINSISLKDGEDGFIRKATYLNKWGVAFIVMLFDEEGQAVSYNRKIEIADRSYNILERIGISPENIIFDPNVITIGDGVLEHNESAVVFIEAIKTIKEKYPHVKTIGGISNVSYAFKGHKLIRSMVNKIFLDEAVKAGLDFAIINPAEIKENQNLSDDEKLYLAAYNCVFNKLEDAAVRIIEEFAILPEKATSKNTDENELLSSRDMIKNAVIYGRNNDIDSILNGVLEDFKGNAQELVNFILNEAMPIVSQRFATGEMFLPQVIKSAFTMKKIINLLTPYFELNSIQKKGKILLATVKGDVHDIGKNIFSLVLETAGFEVIDLGIMVTKEKIFDAIINEKPDIIGLSGLISPSLNEMAVIVDYLKEHNINIPVLIGGAAASEEHTAMKIAIEAEFPIFYAESASKGVIIAQKLIEQSANEFIIENNIRQKEIREKKNSYNNIFSLEYARKNKPTINYDSKKPAKFIGRKFLDLSVNQLLSYFNKNALTAIWKINNAENKDDFFNSALNFIRKHSENEQLFEIKAVFEIAIANSNYENIDILHHNNASGITITLPRDLSGKGQFLSLADFIIPKKMQLDDNIGLFALKCELNEKIFSALDDFSKLLAQTISLELVEAASKYLFDLIKNDFWNTDEPGIRPAPGYPTLPNHNLKLDILNFLDNEQTINIKLTDSFAMEPAASICGLYLFHNQIRYFNVIDEKK